LFALKKRGTEKRAVCRKKNFFQHLQPDKKG
jgi:hypothetical protein